MTISVTQACQLSARTAAWYSPAFISPVSRLDKIVRRIVAGLTLNRVLVVTVKASLYPMTDREDPLESQIRRATHALL